VIQAPILNIKLYMVPKFNFLELLKYTEKYKLTSISGVPPIILALAKSPKMAKFNLSSLRRIGSGAAPLSKDIMKEVESKFLRLYGTDIQIKQAWGMTE
jgi:4-coumarate--CoA ligase